MQGASPEEVRQKINVASTLNALQDDIEGFGTWYPSSHPTEVDVSTTPNRLLSTQLASQATLSPGILSVAASSLGPFSVSIVLSSAPVADVTVRSALWCVEG